MQYFNVFPLQIAGSGRSKGDLQTMGRKEKRSQALVLLGVSMTPTAASQWRAVENPRVMHWGSPWTQGTSRGEWRHPPGATAEQQESRAGPAVTAGKTLPQWRNPQGMLEPAALQHWAGKRGTAALPVLPGRDGLQRHKSLSPDLSAVPTTDAAAQSELRGSTLPSQGQQEQPAGQFLPLSLRSPAEFVGVFFVHGSIYMTPDPLEQMWYTKGGKEA